MGMSTDLAPLGGMLDGLLDRLAALEKIADSASSPSTTAAPSTDSSSQGNVSTNDNGIIIDATNCNDAALIKSLQDEVADLRNRLEASEKQRQRLERQLASAGIKIAEDIPYDLAKSKVKSIAERMQEIGSANVEVEGDKEKQKLLREEYFVLEMEMEKYNNALLTSDEYIEEGRSKEQQWENDVCDDNRIALKAVRRSMPVDIKNYSEAQLTTEETPNGKKLPKVIAKKFKRCNVLQLLRMEPTSIARSHPASLENYGCNGMTLTERRAVYSHLTESKTDAGMTCAETWAKNRKDPMVDRKFCWYEMMRGNLKSALASYDTHVQQCGPPGSHECNLIGNQCPVRADRNIINYYDCDYGYPEGDIYQKLDKVASVSLSAAPEKMIDPKELSQDRVKEEMRNRKRLAYENWKKTYEEEYNAFSENRASDQAKIGDLEKEIIECKVAEEKYAEEHKVLKSELAPISRGTNERKAKMKEVIVAQTEFAKAKRRGSGARKELEELKAKLENEQKFVCSVPKPEWDENGSDTRNNTESTTPTNDVRGNGGERSHSLPNVQEGIKDESDSRKRQSAGAIPGRGAGRGGLLAAIQGWDKRAGRGPVGVLPSTGHSSRQSDDIEKPFQASGDIVAQEPTSSRKKTVATETTRSLDKPVENRHRSSLQKVEGEIVRLLRASSSVVSEEPSSSDNRSATTDTALDMQEGQFDDEDEGSTVISASDATKGVFFPKDKAQDSSPSQPPKALVKDKAPETVHSLDKPVENRHRSSLQKVEGEIVRLLRASSSVVSEEPSSSDNRSATTDTAQDVQESQFDDKDECSTVISASDATKGVFIPKDKAQDSSPSQPPNAVVKDNSPSTRKSSNVYSIAAAFAPKKEPQTYKRKTSGGGTGVIKTALVSCPPPKENILKHFITEKEAAELQRKKEKEIHQKRAAVENSKSVIATHSESVRKETKTSDTDGLAGKSGQETTTASNDQTKKRDHDMCKDKRAEGEAKVNELEREIAECKTIEAEFSEKHKSLRDELVLMPRGARERFPKMKEVNAARTQCRNAQKRIAAATEELELLRAELEKEEEIVGSTSIPDGDENVTGTHLTTITQISVNGNAGVSGPRGLESSLGKGSDSSQVQAHSASAVLEQNADEGDKDVTKTAPKSCPVQIDDALRSASTEKSWAESTECAEPIAKEKGAHQLEEAREKEDAERLKKAAIEKALAEAAEHAESLRKQGEAKRSRKENEASEHKSRQEENRGKYSMAKEAEEQNFLDNDKKMQDEQDCTPISVAEQRIKELEEEVAQHDEMMRQLKKELKEIPRGSIDRLTKMKEINQAQQKRGEARKAAEAAKAELKHV